ncbi:hypothetical protein Pcinc_011211 [Petrolisthes cinctipes]|uniref:Uncharacterized protein n=1 Tax=Petrolisthes cinctipes TaxID=88211 RepID=A0AAE1G7D6_PETCI|nr:hypothetical protein Pcinc_011211 [Petrolisthes cinctipes]
MMETHVDGLLGQPGVYQEVVLKMTAMVRRWALDSQLLVAIKNNDVSRAHQLFQAGVDTDTRFSINSQQRPALCVCVENNARDMVRLLVELGVSINQGDSGGVTPLHIACNHNYLDLARLLLQAHAHADTRTQQGRTSLHLAAMRGNIGLVELLLSHGASVSVQDKDGCTPLHRAAAVGNSAVMEALLAVDTDASCTDIQGNTALHYAVDVGGLCALSVKKLAEAHPPSACLSNKGNETPLNVIIRSGRHDAEAVLEELLKVTDKKTLNLRSSLGHTPLHQAVLERRVPLVQLLLTAGADTNTEDHLGHTPLASAARDTTWGSVALLLVAGARTKRLIQGGVVDREVQDQGIRLLLEEATRQPQRLSALCRRAITCHLGPSAQLALQQAALPFVWRQFLTFQSLSL